LGYLEEAPAFYRVKRHNIKAKEALAVNDKFYLADLGIGTAVLGRRDADMGRLMENLVFLELRRRGFAVYAGRLADAEVDFVAMSGSGKAYAQACYSMRGPATEERETRPLRAIRDGHGKVVITMEKSLNADRDGIAEIGLREFPTGRPL
jgi:predicted AAA+ superfamily ATPase